MRRSFILILLGIVLLSWFRASAYKIDSAFAPDYGVKVLVRGKIVADPETKNGRTDLIVRPQGYSQNILVTVFSGKDLEYGDEVAVQGKLTAPKPFGDFDYPNYLAAKNIFAQMFLPDLFVVRKRAGNPVVYYSLQLKHYLFRQIERVLPQLQAGLMIALVSGDKNYMPPGLADQFNNTGMAHVIAVSGFKLTLVLIALEALSGYFSRGKIIFGSVVFGIFYLILSDFAPAVFRAAVMSVIFALARIAGRKYYIFQALLLTAAILLLLNPLIIKYDVGFILSFLGIAGIIGFNPILNLILRRIPNRFGLKEIGISSFSAQLATAPVTAYFFHQIAPIGPLTNILTVPLLAPTIILGYASALPFVGRIFASVAALPLSWMLLVARFSSGLPFSSLATRISGRGMVICYILEILGYFAANKLLKKHIRSDKIN